MNVVLPGRGQKSFQLPELRNAVASPVTSVEDQNHSLLSSEIRKRYGFPLLTLEREIGCAIPDLNPLQVRCRWAGRLNVTDPEATIAFYKAHLGAVDVKYRGVADALFTERSFILLTKVDTPAPPSDPACILHHVGWAGVDGPQEYEWLKENGVRFHTNPTPRLARQAPQRAKSVNLFPREP